MKLRRATFDDEDAIRSLYACHAVEVVRFDQVVPPADTVWSSRIKPAIEHREPVWVAEDDGKVIGVIAMVPDGSGERVFNLFVYVVPEHRRSGVGSKLMKTAREHALSRKHKTIFDTVALDNHAAIGLMQKLGIKPSAYAYFYQP